MFWHEKSKYIVKLVAICRQFWNSVKMEVKYYLLDCIRKQTSLANFNLQNKKKWYLSYVNNCLTKKRR